MIGTVEPPGGRLADREGTELDDEPALGSPDDPVVEDEAPHRRIDVFVHIPKAVGTTLRHILHANAWAGMLRLGNVFKGTGGYDEDPKYGRRVDMIKGDASARLVTGHVPIAIRDAMPSTWRTRWFTVVRDPVERAISHYYEIVGAERSKTSKNEARPSVLTVGFTKALNGVDYVPDNLQTRMLCGLPEPFGEMTDDHLHMAIANLERLRLVGVAERFDEFLVLLERRLGYHAVRYHAMRVNSTRPRAQDVPEELRIAAQRANELDARLYQHATQLVDGDPELADPTLQIQVEALRRVRRPPSHEPVTDPPDYFAGDARAWSWVVAAHEQLIVERTARLRAQQAVWEISQQVGVPTRPTRDRVTQAGPKGKIKRSKMESASALPPSTPQEPSG